MPTVRVIGGPLAKQYSGDARAKKGRRLKAKFVRPLLRLRNPSTAEHIREATRRRDQSITLRTAHGEIEILTPPAVARILGRSEPRVLQLIAAKKLPATKLGRTWLILADDLNAYLGGQSRELMDRFPFLRTVGIRKEEPQR